MITIESLRQYRFGEYAIFDFAVSFIGIYLISPLLSRAMLYLHVKVPKLNWLFLTLPISIVAHVLVGNITPMTEAFIDLNGHYSMKAFILVLFILGLRNIEIAKNKS